MVVVVRFDVFALEVGGSVILSIRFEVKIVIHE